MKRDLRDGLLLPQEVLTCAIKRCGEFAEGEYGSVCPWMQKEILIPSCFKKLTCEQKIILLLPVRLGVPRLARSSIHNDMQRSLRLVVKGFYMTVACRFPVQLESIPQGGH